MAANNKVNGMDVINKAANNVIKPTPAPIPTRPVKKISTTSVTVTPAKQTVQAPVVQTQATGVNASAQPKVGTNPAVKQVTAPKVTTQTANKPATYANRNVSSISQKLADALTSYSANYGKDKLQEEQKSGEASQRMTNYMKNPGANKQNETDYSNALINEAGSQLVGKLTGLMNTARQGSKAYLENQVNKSDLSDNQKSSAVKKISSDMDNSNATKLYNKALETQNTFAERAQAAEENLTNSQKMVSQAFGSAVAMLPDMILSYGVGNALGIAGESKEILEAIAGDAGLGQMFLSAAGSAIQSAKDEGFDDRTANLYGLTVAGIEIATEKMTGGLKIYGKSILPLEDIVESGISKFKNDNVKWLLHNAAGLLGEGFEEFVSEIADAYAEKAILNHYEDQSYGELGKNKFADAMQSLVVGAISALFMNAATGQYSNAERAKYLDEAKKQFMSLPNEDKALAIDTVATATGQAAEDVAAKIVNEVESSEQTQEAPQENEIAKAMMPEEQAPQQKEIANAVMENEAQNNPAQVEQEREFPLGQQEDGRYNIAYADKAQQENLTSQKQQDMLQRGKAITLTEEDFKLWDDTHPDLRNLNKQERLAQIKPLHQRMLNTLKNMLTSAFKGADINFDINGNTITARVTSKGINEALKRVNRESSGMLQRTQEVFDNAEYLYSTDTDRTQYKHDSSTPASDIRGWDYYYVPLQVGNNVVGVKIAVRNLYSGNVGQVYSWRIKKNPLRGSKVSPNETSANNTSYTTEGNLSDDSVANPSANINTQNDIADALQGSEVITEYNGQPIYRSVIAQDINTLQGRNANEISALARALGRNVNFAQSLPGRANGVYFSGNDVILDERHLNNKRAALSYLFHEVTHSIGDATSFSNFVSTCQDQWKAMLGEEGYAKKLEQLGRTYAKMYDISRSYEELANDNAFKAYMEEELAAEYVEKHLFKSQEEINNLVKTSRSTALRLWQSIKDTIAKLTGIDSKEVAELKKVERMFAKALSESNAGREATDPFFSLKSMMSDISDGQMYQQLIDSGVFSKEEADNFVNRINKAMELIEPKRSFLDINEEGGREDRVFHPFKQNSDKLYQVSMDFSTLCKKRIITQSIIERLNMARGRALDAKTQFAIEQLLRQKQSEYKGLQVACALCYVEAARLRSPKVINQFLDNTRTEMVNALAQQTGTNAKQYVIDQQNEFKKAIGLDPKATKKDIKERLAGLNEAQFRQAMSFMDDEKYNAVVAMGSPFDAKGLTTEGKAQNFFNAFIKVSRQEAQDLLSPEQQRLIDIAEDLPVEYYLTADGQTELKRKYPEIYRAFNDKVRSATRAKALETNVPYYFGDSQGYVSDSLINKMNEENGLRTQSWSDMQLEHILDNITAIAELSTRGAKMHGYTKVPEFVEVLGRTGLMSNLSLIPDGHTGLDANGELVFSPTEGMPIEDALRLRDKYSNTAGTICIGINDNQVLKMMDSDIIDYIIPYHVSGLTRHMRTMAGIGNWDNYQNYQNEREISNPKKAAADPINFSDWFSKEYYDDSRPGIEIMREAQDKYLELCAEKGYIPKFEMFLQNNGDGSYSVPLGADGEPINYWKVLIDRKMIDQNTGDIIEQQPVKPDFVWEDEVDENGDTIKGIYSIIEEAEDPRTQDMVDDLTNYVESAMDAGVVDAIARNDPQVQRMVEEFDRTHLTPEELLETAKEDEWNGDIKDGVSQSQPVTMPRNAAARFSLPEEKYDTYAEIPSDVEGNYGYHAGNLGKAESRGSQGYYRGTGHYGTGTYFVGNPQELRYGYENRPVETVDFSNYNLFAPQTEDDAYTLHDYLKAIDGGMGATERINPDVIQDIRNRARENSWGRDYDATDTDVVLTEDGRNFSTAVDIIREARELMGDSFQDVLDEAEKWDGNEFDMDMSEFDLAEYPEIMDAIETKLDEDGWGYSRRFFDDMVDINRMHNREAEVARMTGRSPEEIREIARRSDYDLQGADPYLSDSRATRFMKDLGYEGIDVRALPGLDNTRYGSVIYDLKGRDLERKNANNPRFSIDKDASDLTGNTEVSERVIDSLANNFVRRFKSTESAEDVKSALTGLYDWFSQTNMTEAEMRDAAESVAEDLESKLLDSAKLDPEAISVLNRLKEDAFRLSPDQEAEARNAFGNMNEFRKAVAPLKYRKDGALLTDVWSDWSQSAATLGMVEEAYNENDLPMQLAELVSKLKESQAYTDHEARVQDITDFIVDGFTEHARKIKEPDIDLYEAANGGWNRMELKDPSESDAYTDLMGEDGDGILPMTEIKSDDIARDIKGNIWNSGFDTIQRRLAQAAAGNKEVKDYFYKTIERPLYDAKAAYTRGREKAFDSLEKISNETGIKARTDESAAAQWYGEGYREVNGKRESYGLKKLQAEFPDSWENIVRLEKWCRQKYMDYLEQENAAMSKVYPDVEERFLAKIQAAEFKRDQLVKQANDIQLGIENGETGVSVNNATLRLVQAEIQKANEKVNELKEEYRTGEYLKGKRIIPRTDYFHHFQDMEAKGVGGLKNLLKAQAVLIDTDLIGKSEYTKPKSGWKGIMQHRGNGEYTADAVGGMARYMPEAEYIIHINPVIAHMRAVISDLVRTTKNTRNANGLIDYLSNFTNDLCGKTSGIDRNVYNLIDNVKGRSILNTAIKLNNRFKSNAVVGNVRSTLSQISNIPTAMGIIKSNTAWAKGLKDYFDLKATGNSELLDQSNFMAERYLDSSIDRFTEDSLGKSTKQFFNDMLEFGDKQAAQWIWFSAYNEGLEKGVADPVYYADMATQQAVGGRGLGEVPYNMGSKVVNLFAPFQLEVNNSWQQLKKMAGEKDARGIMRYMIGSFLMETMFEQVFGIDVLPDVFGTMLKTIIKAWKEKDEEDPDYRKVIGNGIRDAFGEIVSGIPGASTLFPMIFGIDDETGEKLFGEGNPSRYGTGLGGFKKLASTAGNVMEAVSNGESLGDVDLFSPLVETLLPYGGRQLTRTYQTAQDLGWLPDNTWGNIPFAGGEYNAVPGSYTDKGALRFELPGEVNSVEDASELARALLLGEYSTKAGREYLKDRKPMVSATKMEKVNEYADAGYDPRDYIEFLTNADTNGNGTITQAEAQEYLDSTDLDNDQKLLIWTLTGANWKKNPYK